MVLVVKNLPVNAGDVKDEGSIPGSGRSLEKEMAICSSILAWKIPWMEEPGRLLSMGLQSWAQLSSHTESNYFHRIYTVLGIITYMQSTAREMPGCMTHKLE